VSRWSACYHLLAGALPLASNLERSRVTDGSLTIECELTGSGRWVYRL
jgi:hypothetical protein